MKRLLYAVPLVLVVACGGSAPRAAEPPASHEERDEDGVVDGAPRTIEEAQDQIAEAQSHLSGRPPADLDGKKKDDDKATTPPAPPTGASGASAPPKSTPTNRCEAPCHAFASMKRAVEALCRMTGETDSRCINARRTLETSGERVASCLCR